MSEYESLRTDIDGLASSMENYARAVSVFTEAATGEIKRLWADNAELRDELHAVANRLEALTRGLTTHPADVASKMALLHAVDVVPFRCPVPDCFITDPHEHHADGHMIFRGAAS